MFQDLERQQNVFTGIAAHVSFGASLAYRGTTEAVRCLFVSGSYFAVLGLQPALGRLFTPADDAVLDEPHAVVLTYDYWRSRFAGDPGILNQNMTLNGQLMQIIGVAPEGFQGTTAGSDRQVFVPVNDDAIQADMIAHDFQDRKTYLFYLFARLKPGVTIKQATAAINVPYHKHSECSGSAASSNTCRHRNWQGSRQSKSGSMPASAVKANCPVTPELR